jgi:peptidoglycan-N-acetylglucosamine deacetylase
MRIHAGTVPALGALIAALRAGFRGTIIRGMRALSRTALLVALLASLPALAAVPTPAIEMAITFDDLPAHGPLPRGMTRVAIARSVLATLQREHMPPVYGFINGGRGAEEADGAAALDAWRSGGQPLGNHTWAHGDYHEESLQQFQDDVTKDEGLLGRLMGKADWHWLRYPYLHEGDTQDKRTGAKRWLAARGYRIAEVSMDFEDYLWNEPYARCLAAGDTAALARLHDSYLAVAARYFDVFREASHRAWGRDIRYVLLMHIGAFDAHMLPELIGLYRSRGVQFIGMPEALADPAYGDDTTVGSSGNGSHTELVMESRHLAFPGNSKPYKELAAMCTSIATSH